MERDYAHFCPAYQPLACLEQALLLGGRRVKAECQKKPLGPETGQILQFFLVRARAPVFFRSPTLKLKPIGLPTAGIYEVRFKLVVLEKPKRSKTALKISLPCLSELP